ncbi:unnamed protein product [Nezara viridula]|uniref:Adenylyltransferase and sulfurtransferase MOCS3 homolog n=2 Tax=Nezara viridula TaxID=85310 RepID=A0A9P0HBT7_NEZVI|nr:unnamed protein product [Nezara viridula]
MDALNFLSKKEEVEKEINELKSQIEEKKRVLETLVSNQNKHNLTNWEISRYSRQILVPNIGIKGQESFKNGKVLIIGAGGLGCPAAQYLAGCGIGHIGLVDYDEVEENNLHRQLLHQENSIGTSKVRSAAQALRSINSHIKVDEYPVQLNSLNAIQIMQSYSVVIDASDNPSTRYLVNDACIMTKLPLVSGSAVGMEGQLTVYNYKGGPCYRCLFPDPPPPNTVSNCGDAGVLGPVPGVIGTMQALQAIHILLESEGVLSSKLLLFDGADTKFRTVKLRGKSAGCVVCGENPTITRLIDYEQFCGAPANDKHAAVNLLKPEERITVSELRTALKEKGKPVVIDVRSKTEFDICRLPGSVNIPLADIEKQSAQNTLKSVISKSPNPNEPVYVICRRGNDSQKAVKKLRELMLLNQDFFDVRGGLHAWARDIDHTFPIY